jgi:hypothetical protein
MTERWLRAAPALAALAYPALVACGPAVWPPLLVLALASPAVAVWTAVRLGELDRAPRTARPVALAAVGAPALFSLLGGLLDFQRALPLTSMRVWIPLWLVLAAIAWLSRDRTVPAPGIARRSASDHAAPRRPNDHAPRHPDDIPAPMRRSTPELGRTDQGAAPMRGATPELGRTNEGAAPMRGATPELRRTDESAAPMRGATPELGRTDQGAAPMRGATPKLERPEDVAGSVRRLAIVHGVTALPIIAFALAHVANHLSGLAGGEAHVAVMGALRRVYRHPVVEPVLLGCIALQVVTGLVLVARRLGRRAAPIETLQGAAGAYLVLFFASHLTAVLRRRGRGFDTDWEWLVGSDVLRDPWSARLAPYYVLAVVAIAVHLACAIRAVAIGHGARRDGWGWWIAIAAGIAVAAGTAIVIALAG